MNNIHILDSFNSSGSCLISFGSSAPKLSNCDNHYGWRSLTILAQLAFRIPVWIKEAMVTWSRFEGSLPGANDSPLRRMKTQHLLLRLRK